MSVIRTVKRYIRCEHCETILGENHHWFEEPTNEKNLIKEQYCIGCFAEHKKDRPEHEREWDRLVAPYE